MSRPHPVPSFTMNNLIHTHTGRPRNNRAKFRMKYAPHFGMFKHSAGEDLIDQIKFMADQGFTAIEDNGLKRRSVDEQNAIGRELERLDMEMGVFVCYSSGEASLTSGKPEYVDDLANQLEESVELAKRVNAKWMTLVPGRVDMHLDRDYQTANIIEALKRGAHIFEPHGLVMVIEPLNHYNHPDHFVRSVPHARYICKAVGSPAVKVLICRGTKPPIFRLATTPGVKNLPREKSTTKRSSSISTTKGMKVSSGWNTAITPKARKVRWP